MGASSRFFNIHSVAKYPKKGGGPFEDIKNVSKKSLTTPKNGESHIVPKKRKGDPPALEWICISC